MDGRVLDEGEDNSSVASFLNQKFGGRKIHRGKKNDKNNEN